MTRCEAMREACAHEACTGIMKRCCADKPGHYERLTGKCSCVCHRIRALPLPDEPSEVAAARAEERERCIQIVERTWVDNTDEFNIMSLTSKMLRGE